MSSRLGYLWFMSVKPYRLDFEGDTYADGLII